MILAARIEKILFLFTPAGPNLPGQFNVPNDPFLTLRCRPRSN